MPLRHCAAAARGAENIATLARNCLKFEGAPPEIVKKSDKNLKKKRLKGKMMPFFYKFI